MATYPVINNKTGEQKEVVMSVMDCDKWKEDNPDWTRDYSDPSWNQILKSSEKSAGIRGRLAKKGIET